MTSPTYADISHIFVYFDANAYYPEELPKALALMPKSEQDEAHRKMAALLSDNTLGKAEFYNATLCDARNEKTARQFFRDVFAYAFEGGEEPDVARYL